MTDIPTVYGKPTAEELKNTISLIDDEIEEDEEIEKGVKKNGSSSNAPKRKR